jgi:uncharacterized C2H2 Zn-finger protein
MALDSVHHEPPSTFAVGPDSLSAVFQPASQPSGFSQRSSDVNVPVNFDLDVELEALLAFPDANCLMSQDPTSQFPSDWDSTPSSLQPRSDCDSSSPPNTFSSSPQDGVVGHESHQNRKSQISVLPFFKCSHCSTPFPSKQRVRSHIQNSHRHASKCTDCGTCFTITKSLRRHLQTSASCRKGSARPFACKCGETFVRKDHFLRHVKRKTEKSKDGNHLAVEVVPSN